MLVPASVLLMPWVRLGCAAAVAAGSGRRSTPSGCVLSGFLLVCRYNPIKTTKTSFMGTMNMLGLAKRTKVTSA